MKTPGILATGSYLPEDIILNEDLPFPKNIVGLVKQKTGVEARRFAKQDQCTSDLATLSAINCLRRIGFPPEKLDAIILATSSPDRLQPATAARVQDRLNAANAFAFDMNAVCSGGLYAITTAGAFIRSGFCRNILVIGAELYSKFLNSHDFSTFPYFGDGAGAVLMGSEPADHAELIHSILKNDGSKSELIQIPAGGSMLPYSQLSNAQDAYFKMVGREVFGNAVNKGSEIINEILSVTSTSKDKIDFVITHQANINIINEISRITEINVEKFIVNLTKYGNTAAASVLIAMDELFTSDKIAKGNLILLVVFGGGFSWGASLIRY